MLNQQSMEVDTHKHLGIYLSNDGSWHKQISFIKEKDCARINIMRRLKFVLDRNCLETIYISFIRSILMVMKSGTTVSNMKKMISKRF